MNAVFPRVRWALPVAAILMLAACVSTPPPLSELNGAQQSIANAHKAEASQYAGDDLARAQSLLTQAQGAMAAGQNDQARQLAVRAAAAADLAAARSYNATSLAILEQRRAEVAQLRQRLQQEPLP